MTNLNSSIYVAVDGDNIGSHLEYLMLKNDVDGLAKFSEDYARAMDWFEVTLIRKFDASVIFSGGDSTLVVIDESRFTLAELDLIRTEFTQLVAETLSIGVGHSLFEAYLALKLAKNSGKDSVHLFEELAVNV